MLKINLIRKQKMNLKVPGLFKEPSLWFLIFAAVLMTGCGKSDLGDGSGGTVAAATSAAPVATADFQNQCYYQGGQMTTAADGAQVCQYTVGYGGSGGSSGFSLNFSCSLWSQQVTLNTGMYVSKGDTVRMQTSKNVGVLIYSNPLQSYSVNGSSKQYAASNGYIYLNVTIPSGCSSGDPYSTLGISSIRVDRCLDAGNQIHPCI